MPKPTGLQNPGYRYICRQLVQSLCAILHGPETHLVVALRFRRVHLTQCDHCLAITLLIESNEHAEFARIVGSIPAMIDFKQNGFLDSEKFHTVSITRAVGCDHVEAPDTTNSDVDLMSFDRHSFRAKPLHDLRRISPCAKGNFTACIDHSRKHDFP